MQGGFNPQGGGYGAPPQGMPPQGMPPQGGGFAPPPGGYGAPPPGGFGGAPPGASMVDDVANGGFFAGLFDFSFTNLIYPKVLKVLFGIQLVLLGLFALIMVLGLLWMLLSAPLQALLGLIIFPIVLFFLLLYVRILNEFGILAFRIFETLVEIKRNTQR